MHRLSCLLGVLVKALWQNLARLTHDNPLDGCSDGQRCRICVFERGCLPDPRCDHEAGYADRLADAGGAVSRYGLFGLGRLPCSSC